MSEINLSSKVGKWVAQHPQTSRVFEALEIDYCCGGGIPLEQACQERNLDPQQVLEQVQQTIAQSDEPTQDWLNASLSDLCDNIQQKHHAYLNTELPRLSGLIARVVNAHGSTNAALPELQQVFAGLRSELEPHTFKEDQVLFPAIRQLEQSQESLDFPFGTVANPIRMMEQEHDEAGEGLAAIRELTHEYAVPSGACNTYRAMLDGLRELELDMHQHIHKENNILFPRAIELEESRAPV